VDTDLCAKRSAGNDGDVVNCDRDLYGSKVRLMRSKDENTLLRVCEVEINDTGED
jgi:hypothetical protein